MHFGTLNLLDVLQGHNELWWWIDTFFLTGTPLGLGAFNMTQVNNFWTRLGPKRWDRLIIITFQAVDSVKILTLVR